LSVIIHVKYNKYLLIVFAVLVANVFTGYMSSKWCSINHKLNDSTQASQWRLAASVTRPGTREGNILYNIITEYV